MAIARFRIRRPLHVRFFFNRLLALVPTFRRAHCGEKRFPSSSFFGCRVLLLPTPSQCPIELHEALVLITSRLRQREFR